MSIVVPTRNRPEFLAYCLQSLTLQTFADFEVIVADNHTGAPCKHVFERFADGRFRYVVPPAPLAMHDSWEFACTHAGGEYVAVLIDKTVLRPSALEIAYAVLQDHPAEVVSWWNEGYVLLDQGGSHATGVYKPGFRPCPADYIEPKKELQRRFGLGVRRGREGVRYCWGKICFGAYHHDLVRRIRGAVGRLFHPVSPDYTSMLAALAYARSVIDVGQPLLLSALTTLSTGSTAAQDEEYALAFLRDLDPSLRILESLPLKGLYASHHNLVVRDYVFMKELVGAPMRDFQLNTRNLLVRAKEDLDERKTWRDASTQREQYEIWRRYFSRLPLMDKIRIQVQLRKAPVVILRRWRDALHRGIQTLFRGTGGPMIANVIQARIFEDIIAAAKYADDYYRWALTLETPMVVANPAQVSTVTSRASGAMVRRIFPQG